eukprot:9612818-Alexandrium_andersonii.AAC.1
MSIQDAKVVLDQQQAHVLYLLRASDERVTQSCREDKVRFHLEVAEEALDAHRRGDSRTYFAAVGRLVPRKRAPVALKMEDGTHARSIVQVRQTWQKHFASKRSGEVATGEQLLRMCLAEQQDARDRVGTRAVCVDSLPSLSHVCRALKCINGRRACGEDAVPGAFLRVCVC